MRIFPNMGGGGGVFPIHKTKKKVPLKSKKQTKIVTKSPKKFHFEEGVVVGSDVWEKFPKNSEFFWVRTLWKQRWGKFPNPLIESKFSMKSDGELDQTFLPLIVGKATIKSNTAEARSNFILPRN